MINLAGTYWYVPTAYLPALAASVTSPIPAAQAIVDQTVWHIETYQNGYVIGVSATNIGGGWGYAMMIGSVAPNGAVKISFSTFGDENAFAVGDGTFDGNAFTMQMSSGSASLSITHWAQMMPIDSSMPEWNSLPGYPDTSVPDLTGLQIPIVITSP